MLKSKIDKLYCKHNGSRICQGDIFRDFVFFAIGVDTEQQEIKYPNVVILTQDCDLSQGELLANTENYVNQFLPHILILPAFPADQLREGLHLEELYNVKQSRHDSQKWKKMKNNQISRYHYLPANLDLQVPELAIDFKLYFTVDSKYLKNSSLKNYLATVNELFREDLSIRFFNYMGRIALPEL